MSLSSKLFSLLFPICAAITVSAGFGNTLSTAVAEKEMFGRELLVYVPTKASLNKACLEISKSIETSGNVRTIGSVTAVLAASMAVVNILRKRQAGGLSWIVFMETLRRWCTIGSENPLLQIFGQVALGGWFMGWLDGVVGEAREVMRQRDGMVAEIQMARRAGHGDSSAELPESPTAGGGASRNLIMAGICALFGFGCWVVKSVFKETSRNVLEWVGGTIALPIVRKLDGLSSRYFSDLDLQWFVKHESKRKLTGEPRDFADLSELLHVLEISTDPYEQCALYSCFVRKVSDILISLERMCAFVAVTKKPGVPEGEVLALVLACFKLCENIAARFNKLLPGVCSSKPEGAHEHIAKLEDLVTELINLTTGYFNLFARGFAL